MSAVTASPQKGLPTWLVNARLMKFQPWSYVVHSILTLIGFGLQVVPGLIVKAVFDTISGAAPAPVNFAGIDALVWLVGLYVITELSRVLIAYGSEWFGWTFRLMVGNLIRSNVFASILRRRADQPLQFSSGEVIHRFDDDVGEIGDFPTWLPDQLGKWIAAVIAVVIMARINLTITLVIFLPLVGTILLTRLAWGKILTYQRAAAEAGDKVAGFMGEVFGAVQSVKVADAEQSVANHMQVLNERRVQLEMRCQLFEGLLNSINSSVVSFGIGVVLLMAGQAIAGGSFTVGDFALFVSYLWFTTQVPSELGTFYGDYKTQQISIERLLDLVRPQPAERLVELHPIYENGDMPPLPVPQKNAAERLEQLEARGLTYLFSSHAVGDEEQPHDPSYSNGARGIENINFEIKRGQVVVVTGRIGSGKSTLLRVLLGLLPHQAGEVRWNGRLVADLGAFFRPPRAAYTAQVPRLFSESLRENLLLGLPESKEDLDLAIRRSVLEEDIAGLAQGLDTLVGPRGIRLSGGQVQRAAAARMFVRDPELLIFDDLSSALDVDTERLLWERLDAARQTDRGITCLVVSHRRPALKRADLIIVMKEGKIEAAGTLEDLLLSSPEMQYLWRGDTEESPD